MADIARKPLQMSTDFGRLPSQSQILRSSKNGCNTESRDLVVRGALEPVRGAFSIHNHGIVIPFFPHHPPRSLDEPSEGRAFRLFNGGLSCTAILDSSVLHRSSTIPLWLREWLKGSDTMNARGAQRSMAALHKYSSQKWPPSHSPGPFI